MLQDYGGMVVPSRSVAPLQQNDVYPSHNSAMHHSFIRLVYHNTVYVWKIEAILVEKLFMFIGLLLLS